MRFLKGLLFYYSLIAVTVLLAGSFFLLPSPQNIANTLILVPVAFLLWTYATNPNSVTASTWSIRFVIVIGLVSSLAVFSYFLSMKYLPKSAPIVDPALSDIRSSFSETQRKNEEFQEYLKEEIEGLKNEIEVLKEINGDSTLGATTLLQEDFAIVLGQIKPSSNTSVQVRADSVSTSIVVGNLKPNQSYQYYDLKNGFYKISGFDPDNLSDYGWVESAEVREVN